MNNAVFGKTLQNPRKQRTIDFVTTLKKSKKLISHPLFKGFRVINENLYGIERSPSSILFNKPIYVGFTVLELSKRIKRNFKKEIILKRVLLNTIGVKLKNLVKRNLVVVFGPKCVDVF